MRRRRPRNTATTQLPGNQKTLQEELPEGGTHIHLADVSCKSLVVELRGFHGVCVELIPTCDHLLLVVGRPRCGETLPTEE